MARAIYVPSSFQRSLLLGGAVAGIAAVAVYVAYSRVDPTPWLVFYPDIMEIPVSEIARGRSIYFLAWFAMPVALSAAASKVIYGLRREIRDARQLGQYHLERLIGEGGMGPSMSPAMPSCAEPLRSS